MKKGILNITLFEKNIKNLDFYINEEYKKLNSIYTQLMECNNYYKSPNTLLLLTVINNLPNNIELIKRNRFNYEKNLNKVITKYDLLSEETKQIFSYGDDMYE